VPKASHLKALQAPKGRPLADRPSGSGRRSCCVPHPPAAVRVEPSRRTLLLREGLSSRSSRPFARRSNHPGSWFRGRDGAAWRHQWAGSASDRSSDGSPALIWLAFLSEGSTTPWRVGRIRGQPRRIVETRSTCRGSSSGAGRPVRRERQAFMVAFGVQTQASARSLLPRSERESWSDSHAWSSFNPGVWRGVQRTPASPRLRA
jgi:hypothetical protein